MCDELCDCAFCYWFYGCGCWWGGLLPVDLHHFVVCFAGLSLVFSDCFACWLLCGVWMSFGWLGW